MASNFLAYFGSKRKVTHEPNEKNNASAKVPKPSEYKFNLAKYTIPYHIIQTKLNHDHDQICAVKAPLSV
jgi:hypothetical protein